MTPPSQNAVPRIQLRSQHSTFSYFACSDPRVRGRASWPLLLRRQYFSTTIPSLVHYMVAQICELHIVSAPYLSTITLDMKNVVGSRIRDARLQASSRVSQEELAARLQALGVDMDQTAISRLESGERQVTDIELLAICHALGTSVAALFEGTSLPPRT